MNINTFLNLKTNNLSYKELLRKLRNNINYNLTEEEIKIIEKNMN